MATLLFKVEIKSKDMIRPVSETPNHLNTHQLSFPDQFAPPIYMPLLFFYKTPHNTTNYNSQTTIELLKNSLSHTLVHFYPLAGRVGPNLSVDCNDEGVEFYEADVSATLAQVVANPELEELGRLVPYAPVSINSNKGIVMAVQVNRFSCGGMAIGVCIFHTVADAAAAIAFVNAWARNTRGVPTDENTGLIKFDAASFFPPLDLNGIYNPEDRICKKKLVTRRLIFGKETLEALKKECDNGRQRNKRPATRVEAVSVFFWKKFIKIARAKPTSPKIFNVTQIVNLRTIIKGSPVSENHQGNLYWTTYTHTPIEPELDYKEAVDILRAAVKMIDSSYVPKIKTGECLVDLQKAYQRFSPEGGNLCRFSSLIRMPLYEPDFGWGEPIWVSQATIPFQNMVFLLPTRCGQGIEAWMNVLEQDAARLEQDQEFLSLESLSIRAKL